MSKMTLNRTTEVEIESFERKLMMLSTSNLDHNKYVIYAVGNSYRSEKDIQKTDSRWEFLKFRSRSRFFLVNSPNYFVVKIKNIDSIFELYEHLLDYLLIEFAIFSRESELDFVEKYSNKGELDAHVECLKDGAPYFIYGVDTDPTDVNDVDSVLEYVSSAKQIPEGLAWV